MTKTTRKELDVKLRTLLSKWDAAPWQHVDTLSLFIPGYPYWTWQAYAWWGSTVGYRLPDTCHWVSSIRFGVKPGARAAHQRSSNFNTTTKTSTELVASLRSSLGSVCWRCRTSKLRQPLVLVPTMETAAGCSSHDYVFGDYLEGKGVKSSRLANPKSPDFIQQWSCDWHQE